MSQIRSVLIVGAGIAGCSTAITLANLGINVTLIEKQEEWRFQSSGIFVYSNGLAALRDVGVLEQILESGFAVKDGRNEYFDHKGEPIVDVYYPSISAGVPPIVGIKRAEMHRILAGRLQQQQVAIRLGTTLASLDPGSQTAAGRAVLSDGTAGEYDLILGADGVRSQVRGFIYPGIAPRKTGFGIWRSVHDRPQDLDVKIMMMGTRKRLGIMPISHDKLYIFGTIAEPEEAWYPPEQWPELMRAKFAEFGAPVRQFLDQLSHDSEILYTAVDEVAAPLPWHKERVLLIGDSAHASTPFMGQGGAMAIEDAVVLARMLSAPGKLHDTLRQFGERRMPMCRFVQDASRQVGEAGAREHPDGAAARNQAMRENSQKHVDDFYRKLESLRG